MVFYEGDKLDSFVGIFFEEFFKQVPQMFAPVFAVIWGGVLDLIKELSSIF